MAERLPTARHSVAAALAAGAATTMAQSVYSPNVVGCTNLSLTQGLSLMGATQYTQHEKTIP